MGVRAEGRPFCDTVAPFSLGLPSTHLPLRFRKFLEHDPRRVCLPRFDLATGHFLEVGVRVAVVEAQQGLHGAP